MPGVVAGTLLTFIPATGDFINAKLLGTPDQYMIGNVIESKFFNLLDYPGAAALSFTLMAVVLILIARLRARDRDGEADRMKFVRRHLLTAYAIARVRLPARPDRES